MSTWEQKGHGCDSSVGNFSFKYLIINYSPQVVYFFSYSSYKFKEKVNI